MTVTAKPKQVLEALNLLGQMIGEDSFTWPDTIVNPRDAYYDTGTGEYFIPLNVQDTIQPIQHKNIRDYCRNLAMTNEFAINALENRISYTVGSGHQYRVVPKEGSDIDKASDEVQKRYLQDCQNTIDIFLDRNLWHTRQQEIRRRIDRDGECFIRKFRQNGSLAIRFVEPEHVNCPPAHTEDTYGIRTDPEDIETVLGYWVDGEYVEAEDIQHRKENVDLSSKRGLSLLFPVRKNLKRAESLLNLMAVTANIQVAIAMIRKHNKATATEVDNFISSNADVSETDNVTGKTTHHRMYGPGTIIDSSSDVEYKFPAQGINAYIYVKILQAELRAIASRLCMPEYMLSADASNANYSSTMVAEGPVVKLFERLQGSTVFYDLQLLNQVLLLSDKTPDDVLEQIEIQVEPPKLVVRDRLKEAQADVILVKDKVMSRYTAALRNGLDPELEATRIQDESSTDLGIGDLFGGNNPNTVPAEKV